MPTYDYLCKNCKHRFEQSQSIKDDPLKDCPKCGQDELKRLIGCGGIVVFKGSGFYCNDYKNSKPPKDIKE